MADPLTIYHEARCGVCKHETILPVVYAAQITLVVPENWFAMFDHDEADEMRLSVYCPEHHPTTEAEGVTEPDTDPGVS